MPAQNITQTVGMVSMELANEKQICAMLMIDKDASTFSIKTSNSMYSCLPRAVGVNHRRARNNGRARLRCVREETIVIFYLRSLDEQSESHWVTTSISGSMSDTRDFYKWNGYGDICSTVSAGYDAEWLK